MFTYASFLRPFLGVGALCAVVATSACSGGGGGAPPSLSTAAPASNQTTAIVTIEWPARLSSSSKVRRAPQYLSTGTASVTIAVQGTTTEVDNPNLTTSMAAPTQTTSAIPIIVTPGTGVVFTVDAYDMKGAMGKLLGSGMTSATIVKGAANAVGITLNGNLAAIACTAVAPAVTPTGTMGTAFTQVGIVGDLILTPKDADGYTIVMPPSPPVLGLTASMPTMASAKMTSTTNEYQTQILPANTPESFVATGTDVNGNAVPSTTCTITRDAAMYVANVSQLGGTVQQSISIYDATVFDTAAATVNQAPVSTIEAPAGMAGTAADLTAISEPQFLAVDANGYLFVTNQGPLPGVTYGPKAGYVAIYAPGAGQSGNVAPVAIIPNLNRPEGIAFDAAGTLYVLDIDSIFEYPPTANGETAPAVAKTVITGPMTDLSSCYGMHIDTAGSIYTACSDVINIFAKGATNNVAPTSELTLPAMTTVPIPGMPVSAYQSVSWLDVAPDSTLAFYAPAANNNVDDVYSFMAGATSGTSATTTTPIGFSQPMGIAVDANDGIYVTNYGNDTIEYFSSSTMLTANLATSTLSGAATGLNFPMGVTVR